jgi:hypothetical protein
MTVVRLAELPDISDERLAEIGAFRPNEIDTSDIPEASDHFWENGVIHRPEDKKIS